MQESAETDAEPVPETWYRNIQNGRTFFVINVDTFRNVVEIQHFDGDVEEIDFSEWVELDLELTGPPEDWSGPLDRVEPEDLDDGESAARSPGAPNPDSSSNSGRR